MSHNLTRTETLLIMISVENADTDVAMVRAQSWKWWCQAVVASTGASRDSKEIEEIRDL